jgi:hypothetical protein
MVSATSNPVGAAITKRKIKRAAIEAFFAAHIGQRFPTSGLYAKYGSAFRTRVSELNRDSASSVTIYNAIAVRPGGEEHSTYWAEVRR